MFKDKILLITGGTGSFGNAVLTRFLKTDFKEIRIFSRDEKKQDDMRRKIDDDRVKFHIGDVRDYSAVAATVKNVDYIFHAAALKQVPSCEFFPMEAVKTNIVGAGNLLDAALEYNVKNVVVLSSDKAAYPINAMGMSKALMEKVMIAKSRNINEGQVFSATRYGNVMASRGSVIPLFIEQIKSGKPITITDPDMTRFMMSLEEAVDLVLYAFQHAQSGDIFVQKSPAATIGQLAKVLLEIFKANNPVNIIGTRHGEKLYETLLTKEERLKAENLDNYFRVKPDYRDLNYSRYFTEGDREIAVLDDYHSHNTYRLTDEELRELLMKLDILKQELEN